MTSIRFCNVRRPHIVGAQFVLSGVYLGQNPGRIDFALERGGAPVRFEPPKVLVTSDTPGTRRFHVIVRMRESPDAPLPYDDYTLIATPTDCRGNRYTPVRVPFTYRLFGANPLALLDYPPDNHTLDDVEKDFLYATGESSVPVWSAWITDGTTTRWANYVWWVSELNYWVAEFLYLGVDPGPSQNPYMLHVDAPGYVPKSITIP